MPYLLTVDQVVRETSDTISLHIRQPKVDRIWYKAGQYLTIKVMIDGEAHYRSYSISTAPRLDDSLAITIKRVAGGLVSNFLHQYAKAGMKLECSRPLGRFIVENSVKEHRHFTLWAGGSGITPIMSIIRSVLYNEPESHIHLNYGSKNEADCIFYQALCELLTRFPKRFSLRFFFSQGSKRRALNHASGRINQEWLNAWGKQHHATFSHSLHYLCGPEGMMALVKKGLKDLGISENQILTESFYQPESEQKANLPTDGDAFDVVVYLGEEKHQFVVPAGLSILEAGLQQDVSLPHSCKLGTCASCMGKILKGKVRMERNDALLDFEVAQGRVLTCQAHPEEEGVEIKIGW
ncbi:MAG: ferredoxin--NADP reductase [Bacteroidota bacterium]